MTPLDLDFVRAQFPVYADEKTASWAYMENAGGAHAPNQVTDKLIHFYTKTKVQPYSGYGPSDEAGEAMDRSRRLLAQAINADPQEICFGPSTTQNTYVIAQALAEEFKDGDEIIVTNQDHEANIGAWRRLGKNGIKIKEWKVDRATGLLDPQQLYAMLTKQTKLVCLTQCSNIAATFNPVKEITAAVHNQGGRVVVDAVSYAPHTLADVKELDVDFYLISLYKVYGPHLGLLYSKREHLENIANQGHFFNKPMLDKRLTPAGPNHAEIACASGIVDYYDDLYQHHYGTANNKSIRERVEAVCKLFTWHEQQLMTPLMDCLNSKNSIKVIGLPFADHNRRAPTIGFYSNKIKSSKIHKELVKAEIGAGQGHFYAYRLVKALGLDINDAIVRLSMVHYNSSDDVDRAVNVLDALL